MIAIAEHFDDPLGRLSNYDTYDAAQRDQVRKQLHTDIRNMAQGDIAGTSTTVAELSTLTMDELSIMTMNDLQGNVYSAGEHWTVDGTNGTLTVGPQSDRNHWSGLTLTCVAGTNVVQSVMTPGLDLSDYADDDFITLALPALPSLTLASSFVDFTSNPQGNFTAGPTASVAFDSDQLVAALSTGDSEMRFPVSALAGVDMHTVTGVRFRIEATGAVDFRCLAIRCVSKDWVEAPLDTDTRSGHLVRPVSRDGAAANTIAFPTASGGIEPTDWPMLFRADNPSGDGDPRPVDASFGVWLNTGSMAGDNTFSLLLRELSLDLVTQLDLDPDGSTVVTQATLNALGRQPDYDVAHFGARRQSDLDGLLQGILDGAPQGTLERAPDYESAAWIEVKLSWGASGSTIAIHDAELNGYSDDITLDSGSYYFLLAELEESEIRVRLLGSTESGDITWSDVVFDSGTIIDDSLLARRLGRVGWYAQLEDGDTFVANVVPRALSFGEYQTAPFKSMTPVMGAQLAVEGTPSVELIEWVSPGPFGGNLTIDTVKARSGQGWQITNPGQPNQGIETNPFTIDDWDQITIEFDILFPWANNVPLSGYLSGEFGRQIPLDLPIITPNRWQHVTVRPVRGPLAQTGRYSLVLYQVNAAQGAWYLDQLSVKARSVQWRGRAVAPDPWGDSPAEWIDFYDSINSPTSGAVFPERGDSLQISGRIMRQDAIISKVSAVPVYAPLGRLVFDDEPVSTPTASFTTSISTRTVTFDGTGSTSSVPIISWEWDFGDGDVSSGPVLAHTYDVAGSYVATLTVRDAYDNVAAHSTTVTVS